MSSNEIITKISKIIVHLLPYTRNAVAYKHSFLYLHNQLYSFYKSLQTFEKRKLNLIEIHKLRQFITLSTQLIHILSHLQHYYANAIFICPLHHIFYKISELQDIIYDIYSIFSSKSIDFKNSEVNYQNQIIDLQYMKIILTNIKKFGSLISNIPDLEQLIIFYYDYINNYFEKNYDQVNDILKKSKNTLYISTDEIKQIQKELSLYKSIHISNEDIKITKKLDSNFFSTLYRATRLTTGELLIIKEINSTQVTKDIWISIYSELVQMSLIKHPFILEIIGASFNHPYRIISRFCKGQTLFDLIHKYSNNINTNKTNQSKENFSNLQLTRIAYQIADGMMFLHSNGIAHCDLTSSNVIIDDNGIAKITNFCLSGMIFSKNYSKNDNDFFSSKPVSHILIGNIENPNYMAPEVLEKKKIGQKSDIYSYGMILWEMAMKQIPFNNMPYQSIYDHVVSKNRRLPITVPISDELTKLINLCWDENPNNRPEFSEIVELFKKGKISFEDDSNQDFTTDISNSNIPLDYNYIELILKNPSNIKFPNLVKFLLNNMTSEIHEKVRSIYFLSANSLSVSTPSSFASLFLSFASCLNFDSLVLLASVILKPDEFPSFIKHFNINIIHNMTSYSTITLLASFAEFFSNVPDDCYNMISEYIPQLVDHILSPTTLTKVTFSLNSNLNPDIAYYIFHFLSKFDHLNYIQNRKMQIYLFFNCQMIESIEKQSDIESFSKILPLIEEYMTNEQIDSIIHILKKDLIIPISIFEFLLKRINKDKINKVIMILLELSLERSDTESDLFDLLHILSDEDFECLLSIIDDTFEILQIMITEKISLKIALFVLSRLAKLSSIRDYILNTFQFNLLDLILTDVDEYFEMKIEIFSNLFSNEMFCSEIRKNKITSKIIGLIQKSFQNASESSIRSILLFFLALSSHQIGCQLLKEEELLQSFSQIFFLASPKDLSLLLKIIINVTDARFEVPQSSLIVSCLMHDLLQSKENTDSILIALRNIIDFSYSSVQEIDLQHSIVPLISVEVDPKIIVLALQLFAICETSNLKNLYLQLTEKIVTLLSSLPSSQSIDIVLSSISVLYSISSQFNLKPYLEKLKLIELIDSIMESLKNDYPKIADQLLNLKNRLIT